MKFKLMREEKEYLLTAMKIKKKTMSFSKNFMALTSRKLGYI